MDLNSKNSSLDIGSKTLKIKFENIEDACKFIENNNNNQALIREYLELIKELSQSLDTMMNIVPLTDEEFEIEYKKAEEVLEKTKGVITNEY